MTRSTAVLRVFLLKGGVGVSDMCDVIGCVGPVNALRVGRTRDGRTVSLGLCVKHRQDFDSHETLATGAGDVHD